ncbi:MAG TPA: hypothetical protein VMZ03_13500 [Chitinophagaceae bacterium]|nr:hypothetical protein [Chitinophagaceae bacterium]
MRMSSRFVLLTVVAIISISSCNKKDSTPPVVDPCNGVSYIVDYFKTESIGASNNGTITINSPVGDTISYKLGSGTYQSLNTFINLAPGNYVITVKNQKGCTDTAQITIFNYGPKYALVKQIILGYCGPCHLNGAINGGKNFDTDASIVASWDRIKARAVDANPSQMPEAPNAALTGPDKQKIVDWVNAGHRQSD